jgi:hypothetical protein
MNTRRIAATTGVLGIYLIVKGFKPSPITAMDPTVRVPEPPSIVPTGA